MKRHLSLLRLTPLALLFPLLSACQPPKEGVQKSEAPTQSQATTDELFNISTAITPKIEYAATQDAKGLRLEVRVQGFQPDASDVSLDVGLYAGKTVFLSGNEAKVERKDGVATFSFQIPKQQLIENDADWQKLRLGLAVEWAGGPQGAPRLMARPHHLNGSPSAGLSKDPNDWAPLDLAENQAKIQDRKNRIAITFNQPIDGKTTIVIENEAGKRVRNLISGLPFSKGEHVIEWDGLTDEGLVAEPGKYRWRGLTHPGMTPKYLFSFYNEGNPPFRTGSPSSNWLADHSNPVAAAQYGENLFFGAPIAESGHDIIQTDLAGNKKNHFKVPTLVGWGTLFLLADDECVYSVMEGHASYEPYKDLPDGKWQIRRPLNILRWTYSDAKPKPYKGARGELVLTDNLYQGEGPKPARGKSVPRPYNLAGAALFKGRLYISLNKENRIAVIDAKSGETLSSIPMDQPGLIGANDKTGLLVAFSGKTLHRIDPANHTSTPLFSPDLSPLPEYDAEEALYGFKGRSATGITISHENEIFLSDNGVDQNIKVYNLEGKRLREIGKRGGRAIVGKWEKNGVYHPHGLTIDQDGKLWVTETDETPRRISVWNAKNGDFVKELFGPGHYGAGQGAFNRYDHTQWVGGGVLWKLDFDQKKAEPISTLYRQTKPGQISDSLFGRYFNFYKENGRTFLLGYGEGLPVYELKEDGSLKLWSLVGQLSHIAQKPRWTLSRAIAEHPDAQALFKENAKTALHKLELTTVGAFQDRVSLDESILRKVSFLWVDRNGDDLVQTEEVEFLKNGDFLNSSYWGTGGQTLTINFPATVNNNPVLLRFKPNGFLPSGAPNYSLQEALQSAVPLEFPSTGDSSIQDQRGNQIFNTSPMQAVDPTGKTLWTFPNEWIGVHGSHKAPLPEPGVLQGVLYFLGAAPLDEQSDLLMMNGNHGRFFLMTTDGLYVDEMFKDVRVNQVQDAYMIGGECFGGYFNKAENGKFYLQSGHTDYRIFEIEGPESIQRLAGGTFEVTPQQVTSAQAKLERKAAEANTARLLEIPFITDEKRYGQSATQWPIPWMINWGDNSKLYPYGQVKIARSKENLYLAFDVKDPTPWRNKGTDWTMLFKTGDTVDFQFSTDPQAKPDRRGPVPGDKRLLVSQLNEQPIAVLYSYREPDAKEPVSFSSPWRTEQVDRVTELKNAKIHVTPREGSYQVVLTVPLADLGIPATPEPIKLQGDFGITYSDSEGTTTLLRSYWSNQATGLVNDVPGEVAITPNLWGTLQFNAPSKE